MCLASGLVIPATVANHKIPHRGNEKFFFEGELNSLCETHHNSSVAQTERHGFTREIGLDGYPVDVFHPFNQLELKNK
jgi:hypothetical protein